MMTLKIASREDQGFGSSNDLHIFALLLSFFGLPYIPGLTQRPFQPKKTAQDAPKTAREHGPRDST